MAQGFERGKEFTAGRNDAKRIFSSGYLFSEEEEVNLP